MRDLTPAGRAINTKIGKAIHDYSLIEDGDKILVAVSGGKDSLTLLHLLKKIQSWAPVKYELFAAHISTDFHCGGCVHNNVLTSVFTGLGIEYRFKDIKVLDEKGNTTCFWCSWNKRKALFEIADELGCNKVALGHHKDDIVETMLMNLIYNGEISAMNPRQELFKGKITLIRPLCYVEEDLTRKFSKESAFPEQLCRCPFGQDSRRKFIKDFIAQASKVSGKMDIKTNIFRSMARIKAEYIDVKEEEQS
jgi:tRNA 2-thiocytidine biosynthesis protein TtcA